MKSQKKAHSKSKIKSGATVEVITGDDKGKRGTVLEVKLNPLKVKVQGVRLQKKHDKKEGILSREGFIDYSNVKLVQAAAAAGAKKKAKKKTSKAESK
jgi:large subunit ribosomal protein L24